MDAPDLFWPPLVAAYTGMRISEATAIRCDDVRCANGVHYIHIPESKTTAGVRNAPISDALSPRELANDRRLIVEHARISVRLYQS